MNISILVRYRIPSSRINMAARYTITCREFTFQEQAKSISETDKIKQFDVLPHRKRSSTSNLASHSDTIIITTGQPVLGLTFDRVATTVTSMTRQGSDSGIFRTRGGRRLSIGLGKTRVLDVAVNFSDKLPV